MLSFQKIGWICAQYTTNHTYFAMLQTKQSLSPFPHGVPLPNGLNIDTPLHAGASTIGLKLNQLWLRVRDPQKSLEFYINLMGMQTVFTTNAGPFTGCFLGYLQTAHHREDLAVFGRETSITHTLGLLELFHVHGSEKQPDGYYQSGNEPPNLGFCHLGFSVPDLPETLQRLKEHGVSIVKNLGTATR